MRTVAIFLPLLALCACKQVFRKNNATGNGSFTASGAPASYNWAQQMGVTLDPVRDSVWEQPVQYYIGQPECSSLATSFYQGSFPLGNPDSAAALFALTNTSNSDLRPFYRWCLTKAMQLQNGEADASAISNAALSDGNVTTLEEQNNPADSLYPDFIKQIVNADHIVQIETLLLKFDLENQRVLVVSETENWNAYGDLVNNNLSGDGIMNFDTDVINGVDVLRMLLTGSLNSSDYQSALDRSTTKVQFKMFPNTISSQFALASFSEIINRESTLKPVGKFGLLNEVKAARFEMWREETGFSDCWDNKRWLLADYKIVYQPVVFYFSLQSKIKSMWACTNTNFIMIPTYDANLRIQGTAKYRRKGSNSDVNLSQNDTDFDRELNWRAYSNSRSLTKFDFNITFSIKRQQDANYVVFPGLRIVRGY